MKTTAKLLLAFLALSLILSGCCWHHRHHGRHACKGEKPCACPCPSAPAQGEPGAHAH